MLRTQAACCRNEREPGRTGMAARAAVPAILSLATLAGCALVSATPPQADVVQVRLRAADVLHQVLDLSLCITNPNDNALAFRRVRVALDVAGASIADADTVVPVLLPPHASTLVPVSVVTTALAAGAGLAQVFQTGGIEYRVHGSVQLEGALGITLPFSRKGRLDVLSAANLALADPATPRNAACGPSL